MIGHETEIKNGFTNVEALISNLLSNYLSIAKSHQNNIICSHKISEKRF